MFGSLTLRREASSAEVRILASFTISTNRFLRRSVTSVRGKFFLVVEGTMGTEVTVGLEEGMVELEEDLDVEEEEEADARGVRVEDDEEED
jgi:hypothetical protein